MLNLEHFTFIVLLFILAPIVGAIVLLLLFFFEKQLDLLKVRTQQIELEKELQKTLYNQLSQQIQPHFMFNTLNGILSLARLKRNDELVRALEVFSQFLKFKYNTNEPLIPLWDEIRYTEYYIEIQKLRFGQRLTVTMQYDESVQEASIPPFVLQTIVENCFKHGLERKAGAAELAIHCFCDEDKVTIDVYDNGAIREEGMTMMEEESAESSSGHGLNNIRQRLELYFGNQGNLLFQSSEEIGTSVQVTFPYIMIIQN